MEDTAREKEVVPITSTNRRFVISGGHQGSSSVGLIGGSPSERKYDVRHVSVRPKRRSIIIDINEHVGKNVLGGPERRHYGEVEGVQTAYAPMVAGRQFDMGVFGKERG